MANIKEESHQLEVLWDIDTYSTQYDHDLIQCDKFKSHIKMCEKVNITCQTKLKYYLCTSIAKKKWTII